MVPGDPVFVQPVTGAVIQAEEVEVKLGYVDIHAFYIITYVQISNLLWLWVNFVMKEFHVIIMKFILKTLVFIIFKTGIACQDICTASYLSSRRKKMECVESTIVAL